jgi:hypothetical protein
MVVHRVLGKIRGVLGGIQPFLQMRGMVGLLLQLTPLEALATAKNLLMLFKAVGGQNLVYYLCMHTD